MNKIKKFKGIRYNPDKVKIENCIAPPYDVFNYGDATDTQLRNHPHNIVHIQKPTGDGDKKYSNADKIFQKFLKNNYLIKEQKQGIYILKQTWDKSSRTGIIARVLLDDTYTKIRPHEKTKPGPIEDRLKLTKSTGLNIGSIFVVFEDNNNLISSLINDEIRNAENLYNFRFPSSIQNELYFFDNPEISSLIEEKTLYIADGHHRYRTMIDFRNYMRKNQKAANTENKFDYTMMYIVPHSQLLILPYHRLIKNIETKLIDNLLDKLNCKFKIEKTAGNIVTPHKGSLCMYYKDNYYILTPKEIKIPLPLLLKGGKGGFQEPGEILDVELLHQHILEPYLELNEEKIKKGDFVHYISGNENITEILKTGKYQAGFILNPPAFENIMNISNAGKTMPRKSTYFYPKVPSGIVLYETG